MAGRHGHADYRTRIDPANDLHNSGLPRVAIKIATGTGKTVVMAMLIAWQTINMVATPNDARFVKRFLIITPGITIKDRLRVLEPTDPANYYEEHDLVPADLKASLLQAQVVITNYHAFLLRDAKEVRGVAGKRREDRVDAVICAWAAAYWWRYGLKRSQALGVPDDGAPCVAHLATIIAPAREEQRAANTI